MTTQQRQSANSSSSSGAATPGRRGLRAIFPAALVAGLFVLAATAIVSVTAMPAFRMTLPCGSSLCESQIGGCAFGHKNFVCGGPRNAFGLDFQHCLTTHGFQIPTWNSTKCRDNKTMCQLDSDGDGFTNGEELGDPNCTFVANLTTNPMNKPPTIMQNASLLANISDPGLANSTPPLA